MRGRVQRQGSLDTRVGKGEGMGGRGGVGLRAARQACQRTRMPENGCSLSAGVQG